MIKARMINYYMKVALETGQLSYSTRKKVGCIAVKDDKIISIGYNGSLPGTSNVLEDENGVTKQTVVHAEANCLLKLAASTESSKGAALFLTLSPCIECAKMIIVSGVTTLYYNEIYRDRAGLDFIEQYSKINVIKVDWINV